MYNQQQLDFIRAFWDKELTEGCYVIVDSVWQKYSEKPQKWRIAKYITDWKYLSRTQILTCNDRNRRFKSSWELREILWHPVEWHHVFAKLEENDRFHIFGRKNWNYELWYINAYDETVSKIKIDPFLSPMEQPTLMEELLKLIPKP